MIRVPFCGKDRLPEAGADPAAGCDPGPEGGELAPWSPNGPPESVYYDLASFSCVTAHYQLVMLLLLLESLQALSQKTQLHSLSWPTLDPHGAVWCAMTLYSIIYCMSCKLYSCLDLNWAVQCVRPFVLLRGVGGTETSWLHRADWKWGRFGVCSVK
jgi:hypothetical protein